MNASSSSPAAENAGKALRRQFIRFAFYRVSPRWRRLGGRIQAAQKREFAAAVRTFDRRMLLRPYSLVGTRADAELLLWQVADSVDLFHELSAALARTGLGGYLRVAASYLSQTKRSMYEIRDEEGEEAQRLVISPSESRYLFVYPFVKTRAWYKLPMPERQRMMDEHIRVGRKYPSVKLNTTYSFGLDDQEFVVAFETDEPGDFLDLVQDLRATDASLHTLRDTPLYTCINMSLEEALDALGGPPTAQDAPAPAARRWTVVCRQEDLPPGGRKVVYAGGQQIALFNVAGRLLGISNRCSHARGPLGEGEVDAAECSVTCPWHYAKFDLASGRVIDGVAGAPVTAFEVEVREGQVCIGPMKQAAREAKAAAEVSRG